MVFPKALADRALVAGLGKVDVAGVRQDHCSTRDNDQLLRNSSLLSVITPAPPLHMLADGQV